MESEIVIAKEIFKGLSFDKEELDIIKSVFHKVNCKKGSFLLKENDTVANLYYILDGCLRSYYVDKQGKEHTFQFGIKDWWITDYTAYFLNEKALMHIEVLQDATLYSLSKADKEYLYKQIPSIESFLEKIRKSFWFFSKRILSNLYQTATERYLKFIQEYPNIEQCLKNYHIASYLGITTESLSRIRRELANK